MANKERGQNPVVGDDLALRMFIYNSNHRQDVDDIEKVEIFYLDKTLITEENPDGRRLVETVLSSSIGKVEDGFDGQYLTTVNLESPQYVIGRYVDVWHLVFREDESIAKVENTFEILPDLWYTSPRPIFYDFSFAFYPNRIRKGERKYINIDVNPNVPNAADLENYYRSLAAASPLCISIEQVCGDCVPEEEDLRLIVDKATVDLRNGCQGHYLLDTESLEMNSGIYNVWFQMDFGENRYISEKQQLQIH